MSLFRNIKNWFKYKEAKTKEDSLTVHKGEVVGDILFCNHYDKYKKDAKDLSNIIIIFEYDDEVDVQNVLDFITYCTIYKIKMITKQNRETGMNYMIVAGSAGSYSKLILKVTEETNLFLMELRRIIVFTSPIGFEEVIEKGVIDKDEFLSDNNFTIGDTKADYRNALNRVGKGEVIFQIIELDDLTQLYYKLIDSYGLKQYLSLPELMELSTIVIVEDNGDEDPLTVKDTIIFSREYDAYIYKIYMKDLIQAISENNAYSIYTIFINKFEDTFYLSKLGSFYTNRSKIFGIDNMDTNDPYLSVDEVIE